MKGWTYIDVYGPIVNELMVKAKMPREANITKIESGGPIHKWNGAVDPLKGKVIVGWTYIVYYEYEKKDEKIIKDWSDRNDYKRRPKH